VTVGSLARYNSVLAAIPLVQFLFIAGSRSDAGWWRAWRSIALASTVTIVLFVAGHAALTNWLRPEKVYHASRVYLFDLIGTSRQAHVNLVPGRWTEEERREMVTTCYAPRSFDFTWLKCDWVLQRVQDAGQWRQLPRHWRRAVQSHPLAYAAHRLAYVGTFFMKAHLVFNAEVTRESIDYGFTGNVIFRSISTAILGIAATRPWTMFFTQGFWFLAAPSSFFCICSTEAGIPPRRIPDWSRRRLQLCTQPRLPSWASLTTSGMCIGESAAAAWRARLRWTAGGRRALNPWTPTTRRRRLSRRACRQRGMR
jgi:hypothetical protein